MKKSGFFAIFLALVVTTNLCLAAADESLVLYFRFDEGSGDTAQDLSGKDNNGAIIGADWVDGKISKALEFSVGSYVEVPHNEILSIEKDITVMAWVYPNVGATGELMIISKGAWAANDLPYELSYYVPSNLIYWQFYDDGGRDNCNIPLPTFGEWHHVAATYDGSVFKLYMDGEFKKEYAYAGVLPQNTANVTVGKRSKVDDCYFQGILDEVALFNRALEADEIVAAMDGLDAAPVEPADSLITLWGSIKSE